MAETFEAYTENLTYDYGFLCVNPDGSYTTKNGIKCKVEYSSENEIWWLTFNNRTEWLQALQCNHGLS